MGLEQFLTAEDKIASLTDIQSFMYKELYVTCVRAGIDPDTFDYETWVKPEYVMENGHLNPIYEMMAQMCENLMIIDNKLSGI